MYLTAAAVCNHAHCEKKISMLTKGACKRQLAYSTGTLWRAHFGDMCTTEKYQSNALSTLYLSIFLLSSNSFDWSPKVFQPNGKITESDKFLFYDGVANVSIDNKMRYTHSSFTGEKHECVPVKLKSAQQKCALHNCMVIYHCWDRSTLFSVKSAWQTSQIIKCSSDNLWST